MDFFVGFLGFECVEIYFFLVGGFCVVGVLILFVFGIFVIIVMFGFVRELKGFDVRKENEFLIRIFFIMMVIFVFIFL